MKAKKKKIVGLTLCSFLLGITVYSGYRTYDTYRQIKESLLLIEDVEALAVDENVHGTMMQYYLNAPKECTITEYYSCKAGITIPNWVPKIGGTACNVDIKIPYESKGTENPCLFTGNKDNYCDYYRCEKNK